MGFVPPTVKLITDVLPDNLRSGTHKGGVQPLPSNSFPYPLSGGKGHWATIRESTQCSSPHPLTPGFDYPMFCSTYSKWLSPKVTGANSQSKFEVYYIQRYSCDTQFVLTSRKSTEPSSSARVRFRHGQHAPHHFLENFRGSYQNPTPATLIS